jgi:hypothetical protein|uniref:Uncharacterized protein n=1 Tax=Picea glauca TaxID=3330 RepID=A0A101LXC9_PICGL|nr:hypothetical protein ABT39_MTgene6091 [Picea glauca]
MLIRMLSKLLVLQPMLPSLLLPVLLGFYIDLALALDLNLELEEVLPPLL